MTKTVCLNMIVKNEMANLPRCLAAAAPHVDCYAICDTGSSDGTPEMIEAFFRDRNIPGIVPRAVFRDFAQARNEALDAARASALAFDYILLCDADMELVVHRHGYRSELTADAYMVTQRTASSGLSYDNLRLVRRNVPARYKGVTHEYLDLGPAARPHFDGISYIDHATGSNRDNKFRRDIAMLLEGLKEEPGNARYVFYLGNSYLDMDDFDNALAAYRRRITMGGWEEEVFYAHYRIGLSLGRLGREAEMTQQLLATFEKYPHRAEPLHALALNYQRSGQHRLAFHTAEIGRNMPVPASALFVETDVHTWRLTDIVSVSQYHMGQFRESIALCDQLAQIVPPDQRDRILKNREWSERGLKEAKTTQEAAPAMPTTPNGGYLDYLGYKFPPDNAILSANILAAIRSGIYERAEITQLSSMLKKGDRVLELGSGLGLVSAYCAANELVDRVLTVEADPSLAAYARKVHVINKLDHKIEVVHAAALPLPAERSITFYRRKDFWASSLDAGPLPHDEAMAVPTADFNAMIAEFRPTLLIVDIEGGERTLFDRAELGTVTTILLETHQYAIGGEGMKQVFDALSERGFHYDQRHSAYAVIAFARINAG